MDVTETGLDFNFTYAPGTTEDQILGVELAGEMWSNYLGDTHQYIDKDDVLQIEKTTINIHVQVTSDLLPENVIGGAFPAVYKEKYEDVYDALTGDVTTSNDQLAVDTLFNNSSSFDNKKTQILVNGEVDENDKIQLTRANLKALDLIDVTKDDYQKLDGYIVLSDLSNFSSVEWNYDYLGGPKPGTLDFLTTVTHELGHTLGFISGTDRGALNTEVMGYYQTYNPVDAIEQAMQIADDGKYAKLDGSDPTKKEKFKPKYEDDDEDKFLKDQDKFVEALEVLQNVDDSVDPKEIKDALKAVEKYLKYDESWEIGLKEDPGLLKDIIKQFEHLEFNKLAEKMASLDLFRYSSASSDLGANDLTRGSATYFSLDSLQTGLAMSNGQDYQASHWQDREFTQSLGVMNPTVALNQRLSITGNDLMALDAIGWDVNYNQSMDLQALYDEAAAAAANAWIGDRTKDVEKIIYGDAYDARRSSRNSYRGLLSGGFSATAGYFSTFSPPVTDSSNSNSEVAVYEYSYVSQIDSWKVITNNGRSPQFGSLSKVTWENDNTADNSDNSNALAENLSKEEDSDKSSTLAENLSKEEDSDKFNDKSTPSYEIVRELSPGLEPSLETVV
ncbi:MAG: NF038122 family metalloprotease [Waterburya sp.]